MLPISRVIVSIVYYNSLLRDTLEYTLTRDKYEVEFYNYKKYGIVNELKLNTPLKSFLDSNGEKGAELQKKLENIGEEVYGEKSTILKPTADNVRVDHGQDIKIFDLIVPAHEELNAVLRLHLDFMVKNREQIINGLVAENGQFPNDREAANKEFDRNLELVSKLLNADENFYRGVAFQTLSTSIFTKFHEFNDEMRKANGEKTPQASFIEQELQALLRNFYICVQNASSKNELYTESKDKLNNAIEMMTNKRALPAGKNFNDVFADARSSVTKFILISEEDWKNIYKPAVDEMKADLDAIAAANKTEEAK